MEMIEQKTTIYYKDGSKETIVEMVPKIEIDIQSQITQKEEELVRIYNEIQLLKQN
jgi:hypothetical protein